MKRSRNVLWQGHVMTKVTHLLLCLALVRTLHYHTVDNCYVEKHLLQEQVMIVACILTFEKAKISQVSLLRS